MSASFPPPPPPPEPPPPPPPPAWIHPDELLLRDCDMTFFTAGGPGGQHRNKTESGVRLTHRPTGIVVAATERRSQHQNREEALARLRQKLAERARKPKVRKKTKVSRAAKARRVESKRRDSAKKQRRGRPGGDD